MNAQEFELLHAECGDTLQRYMQEASRMCELLSHCQPGAMSLEQRSEIHAQRSLENEAYRRYQHVRTRLLDAVRIGYESSN